MQLPALPFIATPKLWVLRGVPGSSVHRDAPGLAHTVQVTRSIPSQVHALVTESIPHWGVKETTNG